jgi:hypothetical protein
MKNIETDIQEFITHYKVCALWASTNFAQNEEEEQRGGKPMDKVHTEWSDDANKEIETDCRSFIESQIDKLETWTPTEAGINFFLTRNRHGTGFWDGNFPYGRKLTNAAHVYGTSEPYIGDNGLTYLHG